MTLYHRLVIYGQFVVLRARKDKFRLIKKQLVLVSSVCVHKISSIRTIVQPYVIRTCGLSRTIRSRVKVVQPDHFLVCQKWSRHA